MQAPGCGVSIDDPDACARRHRIAVRCSRRRSIFFINVPFGLAGWWLATHHAVPRSFARWPAGLRCSAAVYFQVRVVLCCPAVAPGGRGSTGLGVCRSSQCLVPAGQPEGMACRRVVAAVMSAAQGHRLARRSRRRRPLRASRREHRHALAPCRFCVLRMDWIEAAVPVQVGGSACVLSESIHHSA
jgi:hypothetical protein